MARGGKIVAISGVDGLGQPDSASVIIGWIAVLAIGGLIFWGTVSANPRKG